MALHKQEDLSSSLGPRLRKSSVTNPADQETCGGGREGIPSSGVIWAKSWNDDKFWDIEVTESDSCVVPMLVRHNSDQLRGRQPQVVLDKPKFKNGHCTSSIFLASLPEKQGLGGRWEEVSSPSGCPRQRWRIAPRSSEEACV